MANENPSRNPHKLIAIYSRTQSPEEPESGILEKLTQIFPRTSLRQHSFIYQEMQGPQLVLATINSISDNREVHKALTGKDYTASYLVEIIPPTAQIPEKIVRIFEEHGYKLK